MRIARILIGFALAFCFFRVHAAPPVITSFSPTSANPNTVLLVTGENFTDASAATFNGTPGTITHIGYQVCGWRLAFQKVQQLAPSAPSASPSWNVYRGDLSVVESSGVYTQVPGSNGAARRDCGLATPQDPDPDIPDWGQVFFLVSGVADNSESDLGSNSAGVQRANTYPCIPPPGLAPCARRHPRPSARLLTRWSLVIDSRWAWPVESEQGPSDES